MMKRPLATSEEITQEREADRLARLARIAQARPWPGAPAEEVEPLQVTVREAALTIVNTSAVSPMGDTPPRSLAQIAQAREAAAERAARARWRELWERTHREGGKPRFWTDYRRPRSVKLRKGDRVSLSPGDSLAWCVTTGRVVEHRRTTVLLRPDGWPGGSLERRPETLTKLPRRGGSRTRPATLQRSVDAPTQSEGHSGGVIHVEEV